MVIQRKCSRVLAQKRVIGKQFVQTRRYLETGFSKRNRVVKSLRPGQLALRLVYLFEHRHDTRCADCTTCCNHVGKARCTTIGATEKIFARYI